MKRVTVSIIIALAFLGGATPAGAAKKPAPFIVVQDEQPDPAYDLAWQQPAHVTYFGAEFASFECDNQYGHAVWRSGVVDLSTTIDIPILTGAPLEGAFYYWCEASLLGGGGHRHVIAVDPFIVYSGETINQQ